MDEDSKPQIVINRPKETVLQKNGATIMPKSYKKHKEEQPHLEVPKHAHCELCGAPVRYGMEFCNAEHKKLFEKKAKKGRLMNAIPVIIVIIIAAASLLLSVIFFS